MYAQTPGHEDVRIGDPNPLDGLPGLVGLPSTHKRPTIQTHKSGTQTKQEETESGGQDARNAQNSCFLQARHRRHAGGVGCRRVPRDRQAHAHVKSRSEDTPSLQLLPQVELLAICVCGEVIQTTACSGGGCPQLLPFCPLRATSYGADLEPAHQQSVRVARKA